MKGIINRLGFLVVSNQANHILTVIQVQEEKFIREHYCGVQQEADDSYCKTNPEAEFLDKIQTKVFRVFLLVIHGHLYIFALRFLFLQTHATSYSLSTSATVL